MKNLLVLTASLIFSFGALAQIPGLAFSNIQSIDCDLDHVLSKNCFSEYELDRNPETEAERLERDKKVCSCLFIQNEYIEGQSLPSENDPTYRTDGYGDGLTADRYANRIQEKIREATNGLKYNAEFMGFKSEAAREGAEFTPAVNGFSIDRFFGTEEIKPIKDHIRERLIQVVGKGQPVDEVSMGVINRVSNLQVNDRGLDARNTQATFLGTVDTYEPNKNLNYLAPGACVTPEYFFRYNQFPKENEFYDFLSRTSEFKEDEWRFDVLVKEYDQLNGKGRKSADDLHKMRELKARLTFLNRNPLIKNVFNVTKDAAGTIIDKINIDPELKATLKENMAALDTTSYKKALFDIVMRLKPKNKSCLNQKTNSCMSQAVAESKGNGYVESLQDLLKQSDVRDGMIIMESARNLYVGLDKILDPVNVPSSQALTYSHLQNAYASRFGRNVGDCRSSSGNNAECNIAFQNYCPMLRGVASKQHEKYSSVEDELYFENLNYWNPDIELNPHYNEFNRQICKNKRRANNRTGSQSVSFFDFKNKRCGTPADKAKPICDDKPENVQELVQLFMKEYPYSDESVDPKADELMARAVSSLEKPRTVTMGNNRGSARTFSELLNQSTNNKDAIPSSKVFDKSYSISQGKPSSNFSNALESMNNALGSNVTDNGGGYVPSVNGSPVIPNVSKIDPQNLTNEDKAKIDSAAEAELAAVKKELAAAQESASRAGLEARMKMLEELLAQKDKSAAQYEKLIQQLSSRLDNSGSAVASSGVTQAEMANNRSKGNSYTAADQSVDDKSYRAPASINENPAYTTAGTSAGAASVSGSSGTQALRSGRGSSSFNSALLEAQESKSGKVQRSSDGSIILASDVNSPVLEALGSAANPSSDYSLSVPVADYAGFEAQNMETLKRYQEKFLTSMESNQPVRVFVRAENRNPLEFYVVKDGNKLFFKPVRKTGATLEALKQTVKKIP